MLRRFYSQSHLRRSVLFFLFFTVLETVLDQAYSRSNVQSGWLKTGIVCAGEGVNIRGILANCSTWSSITAADQDTLIAGIPILAAEEMELKSISEGYTGTVSDEKMMERFQHILGPVHVGPVEKHSDKTVQDLCVGRWRATLLRPRAIRLNHHVYYQ
jgi:hypothetical protein